MAEFRVRCFLPWQVEPFLKVEAPSCSPGRHAIFHRVICVSMKGYTAYPARIPWNSLIFVGILAEKQICAPTCHFMQTFTFSNVSFSRVQNVVQTLDSTVLPKAIDIQYCTWYLQYLYRCVWICIYIIHTPCSLRLHIQCRTTSLCWHACMESHASQSCHVHHWSKAIHVILSRPKWSAARWKIHNTFTMRFAHLAKKLWKLPSYDSWIDKNGVFGDLSALYTDTLLRYCVGAFFARTGAFGPKHATS